MLILSSSKANPPSRMEVVADSIESELTRRRCLLPYSRDRTKAVIMDVLQNVSRKSVSNPTDSSGIPIIPANLNDCYRFATIIDSNLALDFPRPEVVIICQFACGMCLIDPGSDQPLRLMHRDHLRPWISVKAVYPDGSYEPA